MTEAVQKEDVLDRVIYRMAGLNMGMFDIPYRPLADLRAAYYYISKDLGELTYGGWVKSSVCHNLNISQEELDAAAYHNSKKHGFVISSVEEILKESGIDIEEAVQQNPMFVFTSPSGMYGAATMMYPELFRQVADRLGCDLYIIPASIHEVLAVPVNHRVPAGELKKMVQTVNEEKAAVQEEDILSNNLYRYSRCAGKIILT